MRKLYWKIVRKLAHCEGCGKTNTVHMSMAPEAMKFADTLRDAMPIFEELDADYKKALATQEKLGNLLSRNIPDPKQTTTFSCSEDK